MSTSQNTFSMIDFAQLLQKLPTWIEPLLVKIRFNTYLRGLIRIMTPFFFGVVSSDAFIHFVSSLSATEQEGFIAAAMGAYYLVARKLESIYPRAGFLMLGAKGAPHYDVESNQAEVLAISAEEALALGNNEVREAAVPFS